MTWKGQEILTDLSFIILVFCTACDFYSQTLEHVAPNNAFGLHINMQDSEITHCYSHITIIYGIQFQWS